MEQGGVCHSHCDLYGMNLKIVNLEMLNLVIALKAWSQKWAHSMVKFYCDNLVVVQVVRTEKTKDHMLALCLRNIWLISATYEIHLDIDHIQGTSNKVADLLSCLYSNKTLDLTLFEESRIFIHSIGFPYSFFSLDYNI